MNPQQLQQFVRDVQNAFNQVGQQMSFNAQANNRQLVGIRRRLYGLDARAMMSDKGLTPRYPIEFRAQFNEDCMVYDLFNRATDGYFIEVGAFDGYDFSVSYVLECLGWTGLLIEGIPERAEACRARRKHARTVHSALGRRGAPATTEFTVVADQYGGMLSFNTTDEVTKQQMLKSQTATRKVTVPQTTMDALLEADAELAKRGGEVDLASIDVEGGELDLLDGFDLKKWRPKVLMLEENHNHTDSSPLAQYMKGQDYAFVGWLEVNRVYVRNDLASWRERMKSSW